MTSRRKSVAAAPAKKGSGKAEEKTVSSETVLNRTPVLPRRATLTECNALAAEHEAARRKQSADKAAFERRAITRALDEFGQ